MSVCDIRGGFRMEYKSVKTKFKKKNDKNMRKKYVKKADKIRKNAAAFCEQERRANVY